jgi:hypothetical protein
MKVAKDPMRRSSTCELIDFEVKVPILRYSWAKIIASILCSLEVKKRVENSRIEFGEVKSQCSAYISSFFVVVRKRSMKTDILGESTGSGDSAMMFAPLSARDWSKVKPVGENPP